MSDPGRYISVIQILYKLISQYQYGFDVMCSPKTTVGYISDFFLYQYFPGMWFYDTQGENCNYKADGDFSCVHDVSYTAQSSLDHG